MIRSKEYRGMTQAGVWIQEGLFLLGCFFYLLFRVHPLLILEMQPAVFIKGARFFHDFPAIPGGMTDWLSAFFSMYWLSDLFGAVFLTLCLFFVVYLTRKWIESLTGNRPVHTVQLIPAGLILVFLKSYDFRLSILVALIFNLAFLLLFIRLAPKRQGFRAASALVLSVLLYWATGGAFLIFTVLCGLEDILLRRRFVSGLVLLLVPAFLPYAAFTYVFLVQLKQAYWHNLILEKPGPFALPRLGLQAFYLSAVLIVSMLQVRPFRKFLGKKIALPGLVKAAAGWVLLSGGTLLLAEKTGDETTRCALQINRFARENRWSDILTTAREFKILNPLFAYQTNLALFHTDQLLDKMFAYPQNLGTLGLLMDYDWCAAWAEESGNFYWKLGLLGESQHWATEAYEHKGPTPDLLKRLGLIYMMKGANATAERFYLNLKNVPLHAKSAENLMRLNENPAELAQNRAFQQLRACMPVDDFISLGVPSSMELEQLVRRNPKNKMAVEYLFAYYLLNGDLKKIWTRISDFSASGYASIPRHVQEALLLYAALIPKFDVNQLKKWVHPLVYKSFIEYEQTIRGHGGGLASAKQDLQARFGDTYWYYMMFVKSASRRSESQNDIL
jgi:hypothetical protein